MTTRTALILDLDNTLIDSEVLAPLRRGKRWTDCRLRAGETTCFREIQQVVSTIRSNGVPVGIVTSSPSNYAAHMLKHHNIEYDTLVAYHDVSRRKPHPEAVLKCLAALRAEPSTSLGVGDQTIDIEAYKASGIVAWGAGWSPHLETRAGWDHVAASPSDLLLRFGLTPR